MSFLDNEILNLKFGNLNKCWIETFFEKRRCLAVIIFFNDLKNFKILL